MDVAEAAAAAEGRALSPEAADWSALPGVVVVVAVAVAVARGIVF